MPPAAAVPPQQPPQHGFIAPPPCAPGASPASPPCAPLSAPLPPQGQAPRCSGGAPRPPSAQGEQDADGADDYVFDFDDASLIQQEDVDEGESWTSMPQTRKEDCKAVLEQNEADMGKMLERLCLYRRALEGVSSPQEVASMFRGLDELVCAQAEFCAALRAAEPGCASLVTLLDTPAGVRYVKAYSELISAHELSVQKLFACQAQPAVQGVAAQCDGLSVVDVFSFVVRRIVPLHQLYEVQAEICARERQLTFLARSLRTQSFQPLAGAAVHAAGLLALSELCAVAKRVEGIYTAKSAAASIVPTERACIPDAAGRRLVLDECTGIELVTANDFGYGLTMNVPVRLVLFSDGVAICRHVRGQHGYRLLEWHSFAGATVVDGPGATQLCIESPNTPSGLLPGWEAQRTPDGVVYVNKVTQARQRACPATLPRRTFNFASQEQKERWCACLCDAARVRAVPYAKHMENVRVVRRSALRQTFDIPLEFVLEKERVLNLDVAVPVVLKIACHHLIQTGLPEEGIFRVAPNGKALDECLQVINDGRVFELDFNKYPVHCCSGVIKTFLRKLPEPLFQSDLYAEWLALPAVAEARQTEYARGLIARMRPAYRALLREFLRFLSIVSCNQHANKMLAPNLAIVTAPNVLRVPGTSELSSLRDVNATNDVVAFMISNYDALFDAPAPAGEFALVRDIAVFQRKLVGHKKSIRLICPTKNKRVWSVDSDGAAFEWTVTGQFVATFSLNCKTPLCIDLLGDNVWIGSPNGIVVHSSLTREKIADFPHFEAFAILGLPAQNAVWIGCDSRIKIADSATLTLLPDEIPVPDHCLVTEMCAVGATVWCAALNGRKGDIFVYDVATRRLVTRFAAHEKKVNKLICVGEYVWSCSEDSCVSVWDARTYAKVTEMRRHSGHVNQLCWVGDQVWSCSWDKRIMIWDARRFAYVGEIAGYHTDSVNALRSLYSRASKKWCVWSMSFESICIWEVNELP